MTRRRWTAAVLAALLFGVAPSCGRGGERVDAGLVRAREQGLRIAVSGERPFGFVGDDGPDGSGPALARAVLQELGVERIHAVEMEFSRLIDGLSDGRADIVATGMFVTPERAQRVLFSEPHACIGAALAVEKGNPLGLSDYESVAERDVQLGVVAAAVERDAALAAGVPAERITEFGSADELVEGLRAGRIVAFALSSVTVRFMATEHDDLEALPDFVPLVGGKPHLGCPASAFRQSDAELRDQFDDALRRLRDEGRLLSILEKYGFTEAEIEAADDVTLADLVEG